MTAVDETPIGNGVRFAAQPLSGGGTPAGVWLRGGRRFPPLDLGGCRQLVIVGAHPDDETLGFGAGLSMLAARGVGVQAVSVTDGGLSHSHQSMLERHRLEAARRGELHRALGVLGLPPPISLGLPDGDVAGHEQRLRDLLVEILTERPPGTWCAATWRGDGHPDHEAVGRAAAFAAAETGVPLLEYPVWMWHWAVPGDPAVPWDRALSVPADDDAIARKARAAAVFVSQFAPWGAGGETAMPAFVLPRLLQVGEVVFR